MEAIPKRVTKIERTTIAWGENNVRPLTKRRVAAYARVSTDSDEQFTSFEAQVDYYTRYIQSRNNWEFVGMYTDEGISATNTKHRKGFKRMIDDAMIIFGKLKLAALKLHIEFGRNQVDPVLFDDRVIFCLDDRHFGMFAQDLTEQALVVR